LPTNGLYADSDHVVRFADQTGLNCLPDQPLLFRIQLNRHTMSSRDYLSFPAAFGDELPMSFPQWPRRLALAAKLWDTISIKAPPGVQP
jgi:hypothetical protein